MPGRPRRRRRLALAAAVGAVLLTGGCSWNDVPRLGLPNPATDQGPQILHLWQGSWIAAFAVGALVWGLILWCSFAYRRRRTGVEVPPQVRYNLPIELLYTAVPLVIVGVLFYFTARTETNLLKLKANPDVYVNVVGRQWSWSFNYNYDAAHMQVAPGTDPDASEPVYDAGTPDQEPTLYLPVNKRIRFTLTSPDVIHSFWVPAFLFKLDVVPGRVNQFELTPNREGTYVGKCAELCGLDHSRMLFNVKVVSQTEFEQELAKLKTEGSTGQLPVCVITTNSNCGTVGPMTKIRGQNEQGGNAS